MIRLVQFVLYVNSKPKIKFVGDFGTDYSIKPGLLGQNLLGMFW